MISIRSGALAALLAAGSAAPMTAQQALPPIRLGQTVNGTLARSDPKPAERGRFKAYRFQAVAGRPYLITLRSDDFDAYLRVARNVGGITDFLKENDDSGGETDARIRFQATTAGTYLLVAQALGEDETGSFTLQVTEAPRPTTTGERAIGVGQPVTGRLADTDAVLEDDDSYYDTYMLQGRAGQRLQIEMRSDSFDTYLNLGRMQGGEFVSKSTDDDGMGEGTHSRMRVTLDEAGQYVLRANSLGAGGMGPYTLVVTERAAQRPATPVAITLGSEAGGSLDESDPELDDGSVYDYWSYRGRAGEGLTVTMSSDAFDTVVAVGRMVNGVFEEIGNNDDGPDGTNSQLQVTLPAEGDYMIRATSLGTGSGAYRIKVESGRSTALPST
ncbi:MAG TPA: hypothetical protein VE913_04235 [Longimicrobium sp.]|nr:hypothetical protein [Longimicrobium sp.]